MRRPSDDGSGGRSPEREGAGGSHAGKAAAASIDVDPSAMGDLNPGMVLGKYQIVQRLGVGGMGSVYEAVHTGIAKSVALKTMSPQLASDPKAAARFMREAAAASRLDHPHVTSVTDFGTDHGITYLVMELLRGDDLAQLITREPKGLDPTMVADVMLAVCAGVFAAHESGVIHRDLKPQNIFLSRTPLGETVPKVLDFGISKMVDQDANASLTNTGMVMGTTHYLSPEQVSGRGVDARSDQYALGVILYESLTGKRPHNGTSAYEIMRSISEGTFTAPRSLRPEIPPPLEAVILRAMATRPQDRFESVHGLGRALLQLASPKRRVIWADYYDRERRNGGAAALAASLAQPRPAPPRAPEPQGTVVLNVKPAQLSVTRTHFVAAEEVKEMLKARAPLQETRFADDVRVLDDEAPPMRRSVGGKRLGLGLVLAVVAAGAGGFLLWRSPRLRAQLPAAVRATLDRGFGAPTGDEPAAASGSVATERAEPPAEAAGAEAPGDGKTANVPAGVAAQAPGTRPPKVSPFSSRPAGSFSPFDPPTPGAHVPDAGATVPVAQAGGKAEGATPAAGASEPDKADRADKVDGAAQADKGPAAVAHERPAVPDKRPATASYRSLGGGITVYSEGAEGKGAAPPAEASAAVRKKRRPRAPAAVTPAASGAAALPAPATAQPPAVEPTPEEQPLSPDEVKARRVLRPGGAPILE
jgi:serine/threonine-protein kinase